MKTLFNNLARETEILKQRAKILEDVAAAIRRADADFNGVCIADASHIDELKNFVTCLGLELLSDRAEDKTIFHYTFKD